MKAILVRILVLAVAFLAPLAVPCLLVVSVHAANQPDLRVITLRSTALGRSTTVYVLLPDGYATSSRRYPVLYLLHGYGGSAGAWSQHTDLVAYARHLPLIIVMPDADNSWYMNPLGAGPRWETYHIQELIPYIDQRFRTIATREERAVAGLSMGGMGAFSYAERYPDLFVAGASFSGVLALEAYGPLPMATAAELWHVRAHDPVDLAQNLQGIRLFMSSGNGQRGASGAAAAEPRDPLEVTTHACLLRMETALQAAHVPVSVDDYGPGVHDWPFWQRELHRFMPMLLATLAHPPAPPVPWSYRTADATASVWGYTLAVSRPGGIYGFTDLAQVRATGFSLTGSGTVSIVTAPRYVPGHTYTVRRGSGQVTPATADPVGRLHLTVSLGSAETTVQVTITSTPAGQDWVSSLPQAAKGWSAVSISPGTIDS